MQGVFYCAGQVAGFRYVGGSVTYGYFAARLHLHILMGALCVICVCIQQLKSFRLHAVNHQFQLCLAPASCELCLTSILSRPRASLRYFFSYAGYVKVVDVVKDSSGKVGNFSMSTHFAVPTDGRATVFSEVYY